MSRKLVYQLKDNKIGYIRVFVRAKPRKNHPKCDIIDVECQNGKGKEFASFCVNSIEAYCLSRGLLKAFEKTKLKEIEDA